MTDKSELNKKMKMIVFYFWGAGNSTKQAATVYLEKIEERTENVRKDI